MQISEISPFRKMAHVITFLYILTLGWSAISGYREGRTGSSFLRAVPGWAPIVGVIYMIVAAATYEYGMSALSVISGSVMCVGLCYAIALLPWLAGKGAYSKGNAPAGTDYAAAVAELDSEERRSDTWGRALAETTSEEEARGKYVKLRSAELAQDRTRDAQDPGPDLH